MRVQHSRLLAAVRHLLLKCPVWAPGDEASLCELQLRTGLAWKHWLVVGLARLSVVGSLIWCRATSELQKKQPSIRYACTSFGPAKEQASVKAAQLSELGASSVHRLHTGRTTNLRQVRGATIHRFIAGAGSSVKFPACLHSVQLDRSFAGLRSPGWGMPIAAFNPKARS